MSNLNRYLQQFWNVASRYGYSKSDTDAIASAIAPGLTRDTKIQQAQNELYKDLIDTTGGGQIYKPESLQTYAAAQVTNQRFGKISDKFALSTPNGTVYLGFKNESDAVARATDLAFQYLAEIYGDRYLAAYLQTALIDNPENRAATVSVLNDIANRDDDYTFRLGGGETVGKPSPEELLEVLRDPSKLDTLSPDRKHAILNVAQDLRDRVQDTPSIVDGTLDSQFQTAVGLITTGNYQLALSKQEIEALKKLPGPARARDQGIVEGLVSDVENLFGPAAPGEVQIDAGAGLGITAVGQRGAGSYRIDEEWARQNPQKAIAATRYLMERFPDVTVEYGKSGIFGDVLDILGGPVDVVGGTVAGTLRQVNEVIEGALTSDEGRAKALAEAEEIEKKLRKGQIPEAKIPEAQNQIFHLRDAATRDIGLDAFGDDVQRSLRGQMSGAGFAEPLLETFDYYPGDPGYDAVRATSVLVGNLLFDPLNWGPAALRGVRLAEQIPKGAETARVSRSLLTQRVYSLLARTPEEMLASSLGRKAIDRLWEAKGALDEDAFVHRVMTNFGVEAEDALMFYRAADPDEMHFALFQSMTGKKVKLGDADRVLSEMNDVAVRLNEVDDLPTRIGTLRSRVRSQRGALTRAQNAQVPGTWVRDPRAAEVDINVLTAFREYDRRSVVHGAIGNPSENVDEIKASIEAEGLREPLILEFNPETSKFLLGEGNHRLAALKELGYDRVPVRIVRSTGDGDQWFEIPGEVVANLTDDTGYFPGDVRPDQLLPRDWVHDPGKVPASESKLLELEDQLRDLEDRFSSIGAEKSDLVARYAYLKSIHDGRNSASPLIGMPKSSELRQVLPKGKHEELYQSAVEFVEKMPFGFKGIQPRHMARFLMTKEGRAAEESATRFMGRFRNFVADNSTGHTLVFPSTTLSDNMARQLGEEITTTPDMARQSYLDMSEFAKFLGHSDDQVEKLMAGWKDIGKSKVNAYNWFVDWYQRTIAGSPILPENAKRDLMDIWPEMLEERAPGYITKMRGGIVDREPTLYRFVENPNKPGTYIKSGVPAFSGDMFQSVKLPDFGQMKEYMSFYRRMLNNWREHGGAGRRAVSTGLTALHKAWRGINNLWRTSVLLGKMPSALPLRIMSEEMLRMAAYDYASAVRHPLEWLRAVRGVDEFELFADSPAAMLGLLSRQFDDDFILARTGKQIVSASDGEPYFRAMSGVMGKRVGSVETRRLLKMKPEQFIEWADSNKGRAVVGDWLEHVDSILDPKGIKTRVDAVRRMKSELNQLIGSGEGSKKVRDALVSGKMQNEAGEVVEAGTLAFSNELQRMADVGEWVPGADFLPRFHGDYLAATPDDLRSTLRGYRDTIFEKFYSAPDLYTARSPLYRQVARQEYDILRSLGYPEKQAYEVARAKAARRTADMMFTVGAHTSGEQFLRNFAPFFPAWRELATTWLYRLPKATGAGSWLLGAAHLTRKAEVWINFFEDVGIIKRDSSGKWVVPIPLLGRALQGILGTDVEIHATAPAESFTGLLPIPPISGDDEGEGRELGGILPSLGAPSGLVLAKLSESYGGVFEELEDNLTLFGGDVSLGPAALDKLLEAFPATKGLTKYWQSGASHDFRMAVRDWAVIDGMRMYIMDNPPPTAPKNLDDLSPKKQQAYADEFNEWMGEAVAEGNKYATASYLMRGFVGLFAPFSVRFEDEMAEETKQIFRLFDGAPDAGGIQSSTLNIFKKQNPGAWAYLTGKTIDTVPNLGVDPHNFDKFVEEFRSGERIRMTPEEQIRFSYGMNSYFHFINKRSAIYRSLGSSPAEVLLAGFEKRTQLDTANDEWNNFLALTDVVAEEEGGRSFRELLDLWEKSRREQGEPALSLDQEKAIEAKRLLGELAVGFSSNRPPQEFATIGRRLNEILGDVEYPEPTTRVGKGIDWWWTNVGNPYREEVEAVWDKINQTPRALRGPLYEELRDIDNKWYSKYETKRFGTLPSPQEVFFNNLSPEQRRLRLMDRSTLPPWFLDEFYRDKLGLDAKGKRKELNELASFINKAELQIDTVVAQQRISTSSTEYEALRNAVDRAILQFAQDKGVAKEYALWKAPTYKRLDRAMGLGRRNSTFASVVTAADDIWNKLEAADLSPRGSSQDAQVMQKWLVTRIEALRQQDPSFDQIMGDLEVALGEDEQPLVGPDMYMKVFFDWWTDSAPLYVQV